MKTYTLLRNSLLFILLLPLTSCGGGGDDDNNIPTPKQITFEVLSGKDNVVLTDVGGYTLKVRIKSQMPLSECWYGNSDNHISMTIKMAHTYCHFPCGLLKIRLV